MYLYMNTSLSLLCCATLPSYLHISFILFYKNILFYIPATVSLFFVAATQN